MRDQYDFLEMDNKLVWNFRDIGHTMRNISEGKGSQKRVLIILSETQPINQSELTERLRIQPGSASEVIGKLEAAGLIIRTPSETDRRTMVIRLTKEGETAAYEAAVQRKERHRQMFMCLEEKEKETLLELLEKVNASWDEKYRDPDIEQAAYNRRKGRGHRYQMRQKED